MLGNVKTIVKGFLIRVVSLISEKKRIQIAKIFLEKDFDMLIKRRHLTLDLTSYEKEDQNCLSAAIIEFDKYLNPLDVKVALDVGSRDAKIAIGLSNHYEKAKIYAFECNPMAVEICRKNIEAHGKVTCDNKVVLFDKAVSDINGPITFYNVSPARTITPHADGNIGASSIFKANNQYPYEKYYQEETIVESLTIEKWMEDNQIKEIDLIWMDLQGAELKALKGLEGLNKKVKLIYTEVNYKQMYKGAPLFDEVNRYLRDNHFLLVKKFNSSEWFGDALYVRDDLLGGDNSLSPEKDGSDLELRVQRESQDSEPKSCQSKITARALVVEVKYGGLGDHLFWSHLPRIAKETGAYNKVYISNKSEYRHVDYKRLIWELNPYVDGFCEEHGFYPELAEIEVDMNLLDKFMLLFGCEDGKRFHDPELYFKPSIIPELSDKTIFDPNYVSYVGKLSSSKIEEYFSHNIIHINYQMKLRDKSYRINNFDNILESLSLEHFCSIIISCKNLFCLGSGTATLAAALGKPAVVFSGKGQSPIFRHSKLHTYVIINKC